MMFGSILVALALATPGQSGPVPDVRALPDLLDSLQPALEDFRCEFEGTIRLLDPKLQAERGLKNDLSETFSGVFIWKANGDTYLNTFHKEEPNKPLARETMIVVGESAEHYLRLEDAPLGGMAVDDSMVTNPDRKGSLGAIFLLDTIKRTYKMTDLEPALEAGELGGIRCLILTFRWKENGRLIHRFWIDLKRGGNVFCRENYRDDVLTSRSKIDLSRFDVGKATVWMPIGGLIEGFLSMDKDRKLTFYKEPVTTQKIYVVAGTMEFNRHPSASTFTADYRPGTPVTDHLKQLQYEFGQQKPKNVTRAGAAAALKEQLTIAETQKTELSASSPARSVDWSRWLAWGFAGCALIASVAVLIARRR